MFGYLKSRFAPAESVDLAALVRNGAQIMDVRTPEEFRDGHIHGSVNIPVQILPTRLSGLRKDRPVIVCCATGVRSATAKRILEAGGFGQVHNGRGWRILQGML